MTERDPGAAQSRARYTAIINPISGGGVARDRWRHIEPLLRAAAPGADRVTSIESDDAAHATELAAQAAAQGRVVISVGGDGHIRHVARGLLAGTSSSPTVEGTAGDDDGHKEQLGVEPSGPSQSGPALGIVGAGRGNDFIRHLGLPTDPAGIVEVLTGGYTRRIDVIEVDDQIALGNVYVGLDSQSAEGINRARWMGRAAYRVVPILTALRWRAPRFTVTLDGKTVFDDKAHMVVVANSGDYGSGLQIVPHADVSSGELDLLVVRGDSPVTKLSALMTQAEQGEHVHRDDTVFFKGTTVTVTAAAQVPVHADGDRIGELPFSATLRPASLDVLVRRAN